MFYSIPKITLILWKCFIVFATIAYTMVLSAPLCKPGQFLDIHFGTCDWCSAVCDNAEAQDTVDKCRRSCPDFLPTTKKSMITPPILAGHIATTPPSPPAAPPSPSTSPPQGQPTWLTVILVLIAVLVTTAGIALIIKRHQVLDWFKTKCNYSAQRPVQEDQGPTPSAMLMQDGREI